ncbi:TPA: TolC family protein [Salmonella enterica subsp. enterica serovar Java]
MRILSSSAICLAAAISTGCADALKSDYHPPEVVYPEHWRQNDTAGDPAPFNWEAFNDPRLDNWLRQVMVRNNDVAMAVLRVYRARLEAERTGLVNDPGLKATVALDGRRVQDHPSVWTKGSSASLNISYELDLWGRIARQRDAAEWASQAAQEDLRAARLILISAACNNYWRTGFINQQITTLQQSIDYGKETLRLANARHNAGETSSLDVVDAQQSLLMQENRLTGLRHERLRALNQQAVLLGAPPGGQTVEPAGLPAGTLPQINEHIPASVLRHRPDVSAKESRVREALANVDVRRAGYYPEVNLTGSLGTGGGSLMTLLHNTVGSVGASLTLPFLEWRQRGVEVRIARNDYEQRVLEFKQTLYKAMSDIENAFFMRNQLLVQEIRLREGFELAQKAERLNEVRYRQGAVRISFWLDAQEKRRQAGLLLDENRFNQYQNLAKIYLEFGRSPE